MSNYLFTKAPIYYQRFVIPEYNQVDGRYTIAYKNHLSASAWFHFDHCQITADELRSLLDMLNAGDEHVTVAAAILESKSIEK